MEKQTFNDGLMDYLGRSPTPFHAVGNMAAVLSDNGFVELNERDSWQLVPGKYFVTRNDSSIVAFVLGKDDPVETGIRMAGAHTDSPCLKVKPRPEILIQGYLQLGVEVYGGVLLNPWYDRDLSLAGRITYVDNNKQIRNILIDYRRPIAVVPSLAIHLDREANNHRSINTQKDIPPVLMQADEKKSLAEILTEQIGREHPDLHIAEVLDYELSFYDSNPPAINGLNGEFIASARLDNLLSCYVGLTALLEADPDVSSLLVCNDHEEVGSASASGAHGPFLKSVLDRIFPDRQSLYRGISNSLLISTDNAHGIHP
ncbi:MAG: M18 family aminopeptidase, partial [Pseudomonadales bacterium]|nr:M18 family aminopeptidase [Pseudomonadales bacterium]